MHLEAVLVGNMFLITSTIQFNSGKPVDGIQSNRDNGDRQSDRGGGHKEN